MNLVRRATWKRPTITRILPGTDEFDRIWASLSPEDQAKIPRQPRVHEGGASMKIDAGMQPHELHSDQHGRLVNPDNSVGSNVVLRPRKRRKRPQEASARKILQDLFSNQVPSRQELSDPDLHWTLQQNGFHGSLETVRRASGRRK